MSAVGMCRRCHCLSAHLSPGLLSLCPACPVTPTCQAFQHDYAGTATPGLWVCLRCGTELRSAAISTDPVAAAQAPAVDFDC